MTFTKLQIAITLLLGITVLGAGALGLAGQQEAARQALATQPTKKGSGEADKAKPGKSDQELLRGAWTAVSAEAAGKQQPGAVAKGYRLDFGDGKVTVQFGGESKEGKYKLDPAAKPKTMDLELDDGTGLGIYSLDGDALKLCFTEGDKENRPTEFTTKEGSPNVVLILKRAGAAKPTGSGKVEAVEQADSPQVAGLKEQLKALGAVKETLEAVNGKLRDEIRRSREEIDGVLTKVDADKNTISFALRGTKLTLEAVPMSGDVKFFLGDQAATLNDMKTGMQVSLQMSTDNQRTVVAAVKAVKQEEK